MYNIAPLYPVLCLVLFLFTPILYFGIKKNIKKNHDLKHFLLFLARCPLLIKHFFIAGETFSSRNFPHVLCKNNFKARQASGV